MKIIVLLGPPGSGKGSQSGILTKKLGYIQLSTGDILREIASGNTEESNQVRELISSGKFISDEIILALVNAKINKIKQDNEDSNIILDGFPRNLAQAEQLDGLLNKHSLKLNLVIGLNVERDILIKRLSGRFICEKCKTNYNDFFSLPKIENICNKCGISDFVRRSDDKLEVVKQRLEIYDDLTASLKDYYAKKNLLHAIKADSNIEEVSKEIYLLVSNL